MKKVYEMWKEKFAEGLVEDHNSEKYHKEGSVLAHTLMVFNEANLDGNKIMSIVALLHDLGKPLSIEYKEDRKMFPNHEGISTFLSINFLRKLVELDIIDEDEMINILFIINAHGNLMKFSNSKKHWNLYRFESEKLDWIKKFNSYDVAGRISSEPYILPEETDIQFKEFNKSLQGDRPFVVFGIGIPASGKTTEIKNYFIKKVANEFKERNKKI